MMQDNKDPFEEYLKSKEPDKRERGYAWQMAIGLQKVDGLETSDYLKETAYRHIEGVFTYDVMTKNSTLVMGNRTFNRKNRTLAVESRTLKQYSPIMMSWMLME